MRRPVQIAWLLLALLATAGTPSAQRGIYEGAAALFNLDRVTLVYPAASGAEHERNRGSAERRAAWLRARYDMQVEIVSDLDVTDEQRAGHLVLIGWDNRLLDESPGGSPLGREGVGRIFLDEIRVPPGGDLLFLHTSPFERDRLLYFWSRIDPELDRFLVLPFLGSDWAVFQDYSIENQGMFADGPWPPKRNRIAEMDHSNRRLAPLQRSSEHYDLHYRAGTLHEDDVALTLEAREKAYRQAVASLGVEPGEGYRIRLYVYIDEDQKEDDCDVHDPVHSIGRNRELHMVRRVALSSSPHEEIHLVARATLGPSYRTALFEGLAVWAELGPAGDDLGVVATGILDRGGFPDIETLLDEEQLRALTRRRIGFPAAGLLVDWLRGQVDRATFRRIYGMEHGGSAELAALLDRPVERMESEFAAWVRGRAEAAGGEIAYRRAMAEVQTMQDRADPEGAIAALRRALEVKRDDPAALYRLGLAQRENGDPAGAETTFRALASLDGIADGEAHYPLFARYQLGQLHESRGETQAAARVYRVILDLPDLKGSHRYALEALAKIESGAEE